MYENLITLSNKKLGKAYNCEATENDYEHLIW